MRGPWLTTHPTPGTKWDSGWHQGGDQDENPGKSTHSQWAQEAEPKLGRQAQMMRYSLFRSGLGLASWTRKGAGGYGSLSNL